jgi:aspartate aminotransferase-like enzyme
MERVHMQKNNKLMVAGPTEIEEEVRQAASQPMVYNRTPEFSEFLLKIEEKLKSFFMTKNDVLIISSSGTGAMEAAVVNLLSPGDEVIVVSGGTFGQRWYEIASCYQIKCNLITVSQGECVNPEVIKEKITDKIKAIFVTANETSTGTLTNLEAIGKMVKDTNAILVVDAISSLGADRLETDSWYCDVVITSSQKALALPPGLSFITLSDKAWRMAGESKLPKYYFDLKAYKENIIRGQTPFTPPISLLYQLDIRLEKIKKIGMNIVIIQQMEKALYLRKGLESLGIEMITKNPSNGVIGILFPLEIDAFEIVKSLRNEFAIEITPSPGADKSRIARIGLFGELRLSDIDVLLCALEQLLQRKGFYSHRSKGHLKYV